MIQRLLHKVKDIGWKAIPSATFDFIQTHLQSVIPKIRHNVSQKTTHLIFHSLKTARFFPFRKPPYLLLAYPRSGSSWISEVLAHSPNLAYLREPVGQALIQKHDYNVFIHPAQDQETNQLFKNYADRAFMGVAPKNVPNVAHRKTDFALFRRHKKHILIKEVNIIAADFFAKRYSPRLIILLRHPAALADSFQRMGWLKKDEWHEFGFLYGTRMKIALGSIRDHERTIIFFEEFAREPRKSFTKLFHDLGLEIPDNFYRVIDTYSKSPKPVDSPYQNMRFSSAEIDKWKENLTLNEIRSVKKGVLKSGLDYYLDSEEWSLSLF